MTWNFGDLLDGCERVLPGDAPALIHAGKRVSWSEFGRHSNNVARRFLERGAVAGDKVGFYLRNDPAYMETLGACFKSRLVHVNVNYRYLDDELLYILDNSDSKFVVFDAEFAERVDAVRGRLPGVEAWLQVGGDELAPFAERYSDWAEAGDGAPLEVDRSGDDMLFIYTGGTTGMPKGVMWEHQALWGALGAGKNTPASKGVAPESAESHIANVAANGPGVIQIVACPLMHGTGLFTAIGNLTGGGCVATLGGHKFVPEDLFSAVERDGAGSVVIVGDAFARPMLETLDANSGRWDLSSLRVVISSGVMWSREIKEGLLEHHDGMLLADMFGSSEAVGFGSSISGKGSGTKTAKFQVGEHCKVFSEDHVEVAPGSGERGFIARSGPIPSGYYKDAEKTEATFPMINGTRYSIPGDWCTVEADGTLTLLGRGSACINTAGEKVHAEEVEETLKQHPSVEDALVFGLPDPKWGNAVTAVVELGDPARLDEVEIRSFVREKLAGYKVPKRVLAVPTMFRAPNGKADYKAATEWAKGQLAAV
ncbi:MAG: acyl-CoA synthetase [Deltaproteobacteria bacterium]|nr:acyl-CoA synthetase [Deltaproteobacteria bacterium]MBW2445548.1 acyl-CoA synthetase [Deltaproteobacteria bacterium]